ncbi:MAG: cytochrome c [Nitrospirae bacterium]|nr:MAG: cytochrome c [Nitrospirota bacterium]
MTNPLKFWLSLSVAAIVIPATAALGWFAYDSFSSGFSAKGEPSYVEIWLAQRGTPNPVPLNPKVLAEARAHFADHCAICHANDGSGKTPIGRNVYPKAPDLRDTAIQSMSDGELFFTIHNGIRFTAMPAWGKGKPEEDRDSWGLVHFVRHLPKLTAEELDEMKKLNPTTPRERAQELEFERFLRGEDSGGPPKTHSH